MKLLKRAAERSGRIMHVVISVFIILFVMMNQITSVNVFAADNCSLALSIKSSDGDHKIAEGCEVQLYKIASAVISGRKITYTLTSDFASSGADIRKEDKELAQDIAAFLSSNDLESLALSGTSDSNGDVLFDNLEPGIYIVVNKKPAKGFTEFVPFICHLPAVNDNGDLVYDVTAEPKTVYDPVLIPPVDITVHKVWNDEGRTRPGSVSIELFNENGENETVELSDANNWTYQWSGLDAELNWDIREKNVPDGYQVTYSSEKKEGRITFTVTNTAKLIQTGQNYRIVAILLFAGILLISAGIIIRLSGRRIDEQET